MTYLTIIISVLHSFVLPSARVGVRGLYRLDILISHYTKCVDAGPVTIIVHYSNQTAVNPTADFRVISCASLLVGMSDFTV